MSYLIDYKFVIMLDIDLTRQICPKTPYKPLALNRHI